MDDELTIECSVCGEIVHITEVVHHMTMEHPQFVITWAAMTMPSLSEEQILGWFYNTISDNLMMASEDEDNSYEFLSELCESVGNHYVGVENIEEAAPVTIVDSECKEQCPICLEHIAENIYARKIKVCSHIFCGPCIETWFEKHKTCPVCKTDATQIASISISSDPSRAEAGPSTSDPPSDSPSPSMNNM